MNERKINHQYIENYSKIFSDKVVDDFFSDKDEIAGKEIVSLTKSKQVNFLVIKSLFNKWQDETKKLESPFFDFKNDKVRKALVQFMNTLSQFILIDKEHFRPLLKDAIEDAIYLVYSPLDFFLAEVTQKHPTHLAVKSFKSVGKYVKVHTEPLMEYISLLEDTGKERVEIDAALQMLNDVFENVETSELDSANFIKAISTVEPFERDNFYVEEEVEEVEEEETEPVFDMDKFLEDDPEPVAKEPEPLKEVAPPEPEPESDSSMISAEIEAAISAEQEELIKTPKKQINKDIDVDNDEIVISNFDEDDIDEFIDTEDIPPVDLQPKGVISNYEEEDDEEPAILNKNFAAEEPVTTVNETLKPAEEDSLADSMANKKIQNIFTSISVNQRYMFTNELFGGNGDEFREAVYHIEECVTFDDSVELLVQKYAKPYSWDMSSVEVKELLKVIFRKFRE